MQPAITRLFPAPAQEVSLEGLYLGQALHTRGSNTQPFVYTNYISSLDGRIAIAGEDRSTNQVPRSITNLRDWRLYQELAGQADILVTSGRYFRQSEAGEAQDILPVGSQPDYADIRQWRLSQGLRPQPDIAIMSGSLDIPLASLSPYEERNIIVVTGSDADAGRIRRLENAGIRIVIAGHDRRVDGRQMVEQLARAGYRSIYAIAGPEVFHTLLAGETVNRLYLTLACQLLGGNDYDTLLEGDLLNPAAGMRLIALYHDPHAPAGGQLFGSFEPASRTSA